MTHPAVVPAQVRSEEPPANGLNTSTPDQVLESVVTALLEHRSADGRWHGDLTSSALSTATACCALTAYSRYQQGTKAEALTRHVERGLAWLARTQNADGGWGDTTESPSNLSTTTLCWAALGIDRPQAQHSQTVVLERCEQWLLDQAGGLDAERLSATITKAYGNDRTFSIPILTLCALAGRFGTGSSAWRTIHPIPFELGAVPNRWLHLLGVPMVSYALPALIAVGQAIHHHRPTKNPVTRLLRTVTKKRTISVLEQIQPAGGGFLEAAPLTSFVTMSLAGIGLHHHPVAQRGVQFLVDTVRDDGSWPIDTNLSSWLTTLSINALSRSNNLSDRLSQEEQKELLEDLLKQQFLAEHPYTGAAPGGWAWTDLSGGVPDADDTAGSLIALYHLAINITPAASISAHHRKRAELGIGWLLNLQNRDGGIPTFCKGWGTLPFDRSSPDLTAHALRAWQTWDQQLEPALRARIAQGSQRAISFLTQAQRPDGSWIPLWFGNQHSPNMENPVYGTSRVLCAAHVTVSSERVQTAWIKACQSALGWLVAAQNQDGGWGGAPTVPSSIEETALALEALGAVAAVHQSASVTDRTLQEAWQNGAQWLATATVRGTHFPRTPIGLYFERLWYAETIYPIVFSASGLSRQP